VEQREISACRNIVNGRVPDLQGVWSEGDFGASRSLGRQVSSSCAAADEAGFIAHSVSAEDW